MSINALKGVIKSTYKLYIIDLVIQKIKDEVKLLEKLLRDDNDDV